MFTTTTLLEYLREKLKFNAVSGIRKRQSINVDLNFYVCQTFGKFIDTRKAFERLDKGLSITMQ